MPRKVSDLQKKEILNLFINGTDLKDISKIYNFSLSTIVRQLKNLLGIDKFNSLKDKQNNILKNKNNFIDNKTFTDEKDIEVPKKEGNFEDQFIEVIPITEGIEFDNQKEFASEPLQDAILPKVVYLIVDKNIELIPKMLDDYSDWSFLPKDDLQRMTIEIFDDHKYAKKLCTNNQKLIKVPNSEVFIIASKFLKSKGISRIIFNKLLLAF